MIMKVRSIIPKPEFKPVTLEITLESAEEINAVMRAKKFLAWAELQCTELSSDQKRFIVRLLESMGEKL